MSSIRHNIIKILDSPCGVILFVVALFFTHTPYVFTLFPFISGAQMPVRLAVSAFLMICLIIIDGDLETLLKKEILLWVALLWNFLLLISVRVNKGSISISLSNVTMVSVPLILLISVFFKINFKKYLFVVFMYYLAINTMNNVSVLIQHNQGSWHDSFETLDIEYSIIGHFNRGMDVAVPSMLSGVVYSKCYEKSWDLVNAVNIIFSIVSAVAISCISQEIIYASVLLLIVISYIDLKFPFVSRVVKWLNVKTVLILDLLIFDAVVILGNSGWIKMAGMDPGIHGRRELWDAMLEKIFDSPVIGYGYVTWIQAPLENGQLHTFWHQHSVYLQIMYETGLIGTVVFIIMVAFCANAVMKVERHDIRFFMGILMGVLFLIFVIEIPGREMVFMVLALCYYIPQCAFESQ